MLCYNKMEQKGASTVKRKTLLSLAILVLIIGGATSWLLLKAPKESYLKSNDLVGQMNGKAYYI
ncbi:hypothetical protein BTH160X_60254 [Brochothrix thermosphacta]|nr:hypothetical protein BTH160X_60254 [Brochothrix thermosphacta]